MRPIGPIFLTVFITLTAPAQQSIDPATHHLRHGPDREWADFPERAESAALTVAFTAKPNAAEQTLSLRHRDLRHVWHVVLNGKELVKLPQEDSETISLIPLPPGALKDGANELRIDCTDKTTEADDITVGPISIIDSPRKTIVTQSAADVRVIDAATSQPIPCRLTVVDAGGALVPLGTEPAPTLAIRSGVVYTATGAATLRLPAGQYTLYASRGFEWGVDSAKLELKAGENPAVALKIRREVDTPGYVASDTHIHTFTYSRHGDATLAERMVTLAGEGIELPIATDHNLSVDYEEAAIAAGVRRYFTPVIGNEVTTPKSGHFNVFPIKRSSALIDFRAPTWDKLFDDIDGKAPGVFVILNHARDVHGTFRPFDPTRHLSLTGEELDGRWPRVGAMEVINSGATLNDPMALLRDWMGCVNRGRMLTPIGASDSHDVTRFIVGQGRTYVRVPDDDAGKINTAGAIDSFKAGRVLVSYGLLAEMTVNGKATSGDLAAVEGNAIDVGVTVAGPAWTRAEKVELYANGIKIRESKVEPDAAARPGIKAKLNWKIGRPAHDVWLTAIATGPGVTATYSPGAKPYQRTSPVWTPYVFACSGAVYVDGDRSGKFDSPFAYATRLVDAANDDVAAVVKALGDHDASTAAQAAGVLRARGILAAPQVLEAAAITASDPARAGFNAYAKAWRASDAARSQPLPRQ